MSRKIKKINEKTMNIKIEFSNSLVNDLNLALQLLIMLNLFASNSNNNIEGSLFFEIFSYTLFNNLLAILVVKYYKYSKILILNSVSSFNIFVFLNSSSTFKS